jgi:ABC-type transport system involved in multi-copper enzyme maturation permease subunit
MALVPATAAIAEDRESGTLEYVLAQPVTFAEVFTGKWIGVALAVLLALGLGLGAAVSVAALRGVPPGILAALFAFVVLLALAFVAIGLWLSTWAGSRSRATTFGLLAWLVFVALGTLGVMAAFVRWGLPQSVLVAWSFLNPVEAFRLGVVTALDPDLSLLGPVGTQVLRRLGAGGTMAASAFSLLAWTVIPYWAGRRIFSGERRAVF